LFYFFSYLTFLFLHHHSRMLDLKYFHFQKLSISNCINRKQVLNKLFELIFFSIFCLDHWKEEFWEDDLLYYRCIDYRNDGVVLQPFLVDPLTGGQVGDRRVSSQVFKCTEGGFYNTPVKFRNCAPKRKIKTK